MSDSKQPKEQQLVQFYRRFIFSKYGAKVKLSVPTSFTGEHIVITAKGCNRLSP